MPRQAGAGPGRLSRRGVLGPSVWRRARSDALMARGNKQTVTRLRGWKVLWSDASLSALLAAQVLVTFVAIPLGAVYPSGHALMDIGHLVFAGVCALALTDRLSVRVALLAGLLALAIGPAALDGLGLRL